jgi:integrase
MKRAKLSLRPKEARLSVVHAVKPRDHPALCYFSAAGDRRFSTNCRSTEVVSLKVSDIDSERMIIRVEQGKGGKDRNVMLSPPLLGTATSSLTRGFLGAVPQAAGIRNP